MSNHEVVITDDVSGGFLSHASLSSNSTTHPSLSAGITISDSAVATVGFGELVAGVVFGNPTAGFISPPSATATLSAQVNKISASTSTGTALTASLMLSLILSGGVTNSNILTATIVSYPSVGNTSGVVVYSRLLTEDGFNFLTEDNHLWVLDDLA